MRTASRMPPAMANTLGGPLKLLQEPPGYAALVTVVNPVVGKAFIALAQDTDHIGWDAVVAPFPSPVGVLVDVDGLGERSNRVESLRNPELLQSFAYRFVIRGWFLWHGRYSVGCQAWNHPITAP